MDASVEQRSSDGQQEQKKAPIDQPPPYKEPQPESSEAATVAVVQQPVVVTTQLMIGPESTSLVCPFCHETVQTRIDVVSNSKTHCNALILCCLGGICCFWIPYCMDSCQSKLHYCPKCGAYIGRYDN